MAIPLGMMEGIVPDSGMMRRAALGALIARDPTKAAQVLAAMGIGPQQFMRIASNADVAPGVPQQPTLADIERRDYLETLKNTDASPTRVEDRAAAVKKKYHPDQTPLGTTKYSLPKFSSGDTGEALNMGVPPSSLASAPSPGDAGPASVIIGPDGTPMINPEALNTMPESNPISLGTPGAGVVDTSQGPASVKIALAPPPIPASPEAAPPAVSSEDWLTKTLRGEDAGPPPASAVSSAVENSMQGPLGRTSTPPTAGETVLSGGSANTGQPMTSAPKTNVMDQLNAILSGVKAPDAPTAPQYATPSPPEVKAIQGSRVSDLLAMIFGDGKKSQGPQTLSAALRG